MKKLVFNSVCQLDQFIDVTGLSCLQRLGYSLAVPDLAIASETSGNSIRVSRLIEQDVVNCVEFGHLEMAEVISMHEEFGRNISLTECSACYLACKKGYTLVTNDNAASEFTEGMSGKTIHLMVLVERIRITETG